MKLKNLDNNEMAFLERGLRVQNGSMELSVHSGYGDENHNAVIFQRAPGYGKFIVGKTAISEEKEHRKNGNFIGLGDATTAT